MPPRRPDEAAPLKAFLRHHQTGAVKQQDLDPVAALRTEHHDRARMDVDTERMAGHRRKTIVTLPEINRTDRHENPHCRTGNDHGRTLRPRAISPICSTGLYSGRRTTTPWPPIITSPDTAAPRRKTLRQKTVAARNLLDRHARLETLQDNPGPTSSGQCRRAGTAGPCTSSHCRTNTPFSIAFIPRHGHVIKITPDTNQCKDGIALPLTDHRLRQVTRRCSAIPEKPFDPEAG